MGFFSKKPNERKIYSTKECIDFLSENPEYTAIETAGGFILVPEIKAKEQIAKHKQKNGKLDNWRKEMSGNGNYRNLVVTPKTYETNSKTINTYIER